MLKNIFKTTFRFLIRNKGFSFINILGLSIGIAVSIIGMLYVINELSYDRYNKNSDRIYRFAVDALAGNTAIYQTFTPAVLPGALYDEFPEIEKITRIASFDEQNFKYDEKVFIENNVFVVDSTFFEIFTLAVTEGMDSKLLYEPYTAVITENTAKKYFGNEDPINKIIRNDTTNFKVIAVIEDVPENSHFHFNIALALTSFDGFYNNPAWFANNFRNYFLLNENYNYKDLEAKLPDFTNKYLFGGNYDKLAEKGSKWEYYLQPLLSIHLNSDLRGEFEANGRKEYVYIFLIISIFILFIAIINFINLATATATKRSKEVGVKKTFGVNRNELINQFISESLVTSFISLIVALFFVELILAFLRDYEGIKMSMHYFDNLYTIPALVILALFIGFLSGFYPAIVMSSFKPVFALKNQLQKGSKSPWLRNILVVFQFCASIVLIIGTFVIYNQLQLLQKDNLGFDTERVIVIKNPSALDNSQESFKNDLENLTFVNSASYSFRLPGERFINLGFGAEDFEGGYTLNLTACDEDFVDVMKFEIKDGRFFSKEFGTDTAAIIINEEALKLLAYDEPIEKKLNTWGDPPIYFNIIGIIKDIHYESKHQKVHPMGFINMNSSLGINPGNISVRVGPGDYRLMIEQLGDLWNKYSSEIPFEYSFFDEDYNQLYRNESNTRKLFFAFSFLAIFIACLGLLGLASFLVQQKTKEIGIRKTFGASPFTITMQLTKKFIQWVIVANVIAWPLAWYFFNSWLNNFSYRCSIEWWFFVIAGIISLFIALITVSYQTIKASRANPIDALRYE
ncbi:MAG: ABC transporter permease [Bacteroidales bacterium]|nr:ABC transporter permease [Bacteroidales bacterium]